MSAKFGLEILTPGKKVLEDTVSEVILPAWDGERGVLPDHENFIGKLGTGPLKLVRDGNDYWYVISGGIYEVREGSVSVLAEHVEEASSIDHALALSKEEELKDLIPKTNLNSSEGAQLLLELEKAKARLDVHTRTKAVH